MDGFFDLPEVKRAFEKVLLDLAAPGEEEAAFYNSWQFHNIIRHVRATDAVLRHDDLLYKPRICQAVDHKTFVLFCESMLAMNPQEMAEERRGGFFLWSVKAFGVEVRSSTVPGALYTVLKDPDYIEPAHDRFDWRKFRL